MILVVGATGQLGTAVVRRLVQRRVPVRALVRATSSYAHLTAGGIEIAIGDLRDAASLQTACAGIDAVIATANTAVPSQRGDSFKAVDDQGYKSLIEACKGAGVRQFIYASVLSEPGFNSLPLPRQKRITERRLQDSGLAYTIFRADAFMDVSFAMMGSDLPVQGAEAATVERRFWFSRGFFNSVKQNVTGKGQVGVIGDGKARRSYVCVDDMAEFLVRAVGLAAARNAIFDIGGPQALSQKDVVAIFEKVFNRRLTPKHTPAIVFRIGRVLLAPFSPAAANLMGLNYCTATIDSVVDMTETAPAFGVRLTTAEEFLRGKLPVRPTLAV